MTMFIQRNVCVSQAKKYTIIQHKSSLLKRNNSKTRSYVQAVTESSSGSTYIKQFAFYQAGKCLVQSLLLDHPKISLLHLTETKKNLVYSLQTLPLIETRANLETLLIGFYAGKAGELLIDSPQKGFDELTCSSQRQKDVNSKTKLYKKFRYRYLRQSPNEAYTYVVRKAIYSKYKICSRITRKDLVRVNGLFANVDKNEVLTKAMFRARMNCQAKNKLFPVLYTCDILCRVLPRCTPVLRCPNKLRLKEYGIERGNHQTENLLPFQQTLLYERSDNDTVYFGHLALRDSLKVNKIEQFLCQLNTGLFERIKATSLVQSLVVNGSMYSSKIFNLQRNSVIGNLNKTEMKDRRTFYLFQKLEEQTKNLYLQESMPNRSFNSHTSFLTKQEPLSEVFGSHNFQSVESSSYQDQVFTTAKANALFFTKQLLLQQESVCQSLTCSVKPYGHWFRMYLPQIEVHQRQSIQKRSFCTSADQFFNKRLTKAPLLYELGSIEYEKTSTQRLRNVWPQELGYSIFHNIVLNTFSRAYNLLSRNRELRDVLADHFIRFEKIRMPELSNMCKFYIYK